MIPQRFPGLHGEKVDHSVRADPHGWKSHLSPTEFVEAFRLETQDVRVKGERAGDVRHVEHDVVHRLHLEHVAPPPGRSAACSQALHVTAHARPLSVAAPAHAETTVGVPPEEVKAPNTKVRLRWANTGGYVRADPSTRKKG